MKKLFVISIVALTALFSCTQEPIGPKDNLQKLTFTGVTDAVKTTLQEDFSITWSTEDDITVFAGDNADGVSFDVTATARNGHEATFSGSAEASATYYALSPAQTGASISNGMISAVLPTIQTATAGSFAPEANVSVAAASDYVFQFKNVGAIVSIATGNDDITGFKLEAIGGQIMSGTAVINPDGTLESKTGESYVQLSGSITKNTKYYFVVLPDTYASGFRVTLFKGTQYTRFTKGDSAEIGRSGNFDLGTVTGNNWKESFIMGEAVSIKGAGAAEADQAVAYVGSDGYWQEVINDQSKVVSDIANYPYNYEIFTQLNSSQSFYFEANGGALFTLNAEGTSVKPITRPNQAAYSASSDGVYRIRMALPEGVAEVKKVDRVVYSHYTVAGINMTYVGEGIWHHSGISLKRGSNTWDNRYKFNIYFTDGTNQWYGRKNASISPTYGTTDDSYFYVQPSNNVDNWEPGFRFPSTYEQLTENRYYGDISLIMNNNNGHYTHSVANIWDAQNPISAGEAIVIKESAEDGQSVAYVGSNGYWNTINHADESLSNYPYNYEIFTSLNQDQTFYFKANNGARFTLSASGNAVNVLIPGASATYSAPSTGVYRIRMSIPGGVAEVKEITSVVFKHYAVQADQSFVYQNHGIWKKANLTLRMGNDSWANRYKFIFTFSDNSQQWYGRWKDYGELPSSFDGSDYFYVQPADNDNFDPGFKFPAEYNVNNDSHHGDMILYMNNDNGHYTHTVENAS